MDALIATVTEPAQWLMVGVDCGSMGCDVVMFAWVCVCVCVHSYMEFYIGSLCVCMGACTRTCVCVCVLCTAIWNSVLDHY